MRRRKSLRIGVHHVNAVVWEPVYRTRLIGEIFALFVVVVVFAFFAFFAFASQQSLRVRERARRGRAPVVVHVDGLERHVDVLERVRESRARESTRGGGRDVRVVVVTLRAVLYER
ncbi:uncharacterized protein MICPUCDRAFT_53663 [Micromonas pusilla CCMP1545]|uniref:Predicted protein n=1 Tax=Micromonas pusilla (strain CCMP1545) TaxID=564608 RepID=C1N7E5_MICPC|nr:uncharacterized protein MICPUCDRAFT_53663 [Micromonas pusilla CCMP1545]EEH52094.1 predicted protein [Micromonas pusilla CCMP1545]|eukprot:XP_003063721.1 predicted protein [Micromonas pusilla CCMP1545]